VQGREEEVMNPVGTIYADTITASLGADGAVGVSTYIAVVGFAIQGGCGMSG
jgi:hypothetical protein